MQFCSCIYCHVWFLLLIFFVHSHALQGQTGLPGIDGQKGERGLQGVPGFPGQDIQHDDISIVFFKCKYEKKKRKMKPNTLFFLEITGPKGILGDAGFKGEVGDRGFPGEKGKRGGETLTLTLSLICIKSSCYSSNRIS